MMNGKRNYCLMQIPVDKIIVYDPNKHQSPSAHDKYIGHEVGNESRFEVP